MVRSCGCPNECTAFHDAGFAYGRLERGPLVDTETSPATAVPASLALHQSGALACVLGSESDAGSECARSTGRAREPGQRMGTGAGSEGRGSRPYGPLWGFHPQPPTACAASSLPERGGHPVQARVPRPLTPGRLRPLAQSCGRPGSAVRQASAGRRWAVPPYSHGNNRYVHHRPSLDRPGIDRSTVPATGPRPGRNPLRSHARDIPRRAETARSRPGGSTSMWITFRDNPPDNARMRVYTLSRIATPDLAGRYL